MLKRRRPKRRRSAVARQNRPPATEPTQRWCTDFVSETLFDGRRLRLLTVVDTCPRECLAREPSRLRGRATTSVDHIVP